MSFSFHSTGGRGHAARRDVSMRDRSMVVNFEIGDRVRVGGMLRKV
jgi:hypothetical protein